MGNVGNEHIYGFGLSGDPTGDGSDSLIGSGGNDYIQGNAGADTIDGGGGNDRLVRGSGADLISGGAGQDTVNDNLGNDTIDGGSAEDFLRGDQGNDSISGIDGDDLVLGDLGDDTIGGGAGVDLITGGDGADIFQFNVGDATGYAITGVFAFFTDAIADFVDGTDEIRLSAATGRVADVQNEIMRDDAGAAFATLSPARDYAQGLLNGNSEANDVAIVKVGGDAYIFYDSTGIQGSPIDSIIKINNLLDTFLLTEDDFK
jgi:serralysin